MIVVNVAGKKKDKKVTVEETKVEVKEEKKEETKVIETKVEETKKVSKKPVKVAKTLLGKFAISYDPTDDNYRYRLYASNGECLVVSEIYSSYDSALKGIETLKVNAKSENIELVEDKHGLFSFRVYSTVGKRNLVTSANYVSKHNGEAAIASFLKNVVTERIIDEEKDDHDETTEFIDTVTPIEGGKIKVYKEFAEYFYKLVANNGQVIVVSQGYKTVKTCLDSAERIRELVYTGKFFIFKDKNNQYQFKLYNQQKRMMLAGEVYDSKAKVNSVITSLKRFFELAVIEDETK